MRRGSMANPIPAPSGSAPAVQINPTAAEAIDGSPGGSDPLLVGPDGLAAMLSMSLSTLYQRRAKGLVLDPIIDDGRLVRWSRPEIRRWVDAGCPAADAWRKQNRTKSR